MDAALGGEASLQKLLDRCHDICKHSTLSIWEFKEDGTSQERLNSLLSEYVTILHTIHQTCTSQGKPPSSIGVDINTLVPLSLLKWLDEGNHADGWLKLRLEALREANWRLEGKHRTISQFRDALMATLKETSSSEQFNGELDTISRNSVTQTQAASLSHDEDETIDIS